MRKLFTLLIVFCLLAASSQAQVNAYSFAGSSGTYADITGGTQHGTGSGLDDAIYTAIPIGFSFTFNAVAYTTIAISTNGHIVFGYTGSLSYAPISSSVAAGGTVSPFGRDLQGIDATSEVRSQLLGTSPNQTFTIQWKNLKRYGTNYVGESMNLQVILYETTNVIKMVYGPAVGSSYASPVHPQVGMRGSTNADFTNRTTTTDWAATTPGATNIETCTFTNLVVPVSGQTFTYSPPVVGTPLPPTTPSPADLATGVPLSGSLTWTFGANTTTYDLKFGPTGSMIQVVTGAAAGATGTYSYSGLVASSIYQWQVIEHNGALTTSGPIWNFTTVCGTTTVPFTENFDSYTVPAVGCGTILDVNADLVKWASTTGTTYNGANKLSIGYSAAAVTMDDWYITAGLNLTAGQSYDVKFYYRAASSSYPERLEVKWGTAPTAAGMTSSAVFTNTDFILTTYTLGSGAFTPPTSGVYYVGWHCFSLGDEDGIYLDQITVAATPTAPSFTFVPETTIACGYGPNGGYSPEQTYTIAGLNLTGFPGNIVVTAPANFQVSLSAGSGFGTTVNVPFTAATLAATTIHVRCAPTAPATDYSGNITHVGGGATGNVAVTGTSILTYCASNATTTADEDIFNVTLGTLNNTSDCFTVVPGPGSLLNEYSNYTTSVAAPTLQQAVIYPLSLTSGTCGSNYGNSFKVFIDFNQNGLFTDAGEEVYASAAATTGPHTETGNVTIPGGALLGNTWMRVICRESAPASITACGTYSWGETEDYLVNIATGTTGTLRGYVTDVMNEEAVIGATVSFGPYSTTTNGAGFYQFATVPVGTYDVTAVAPGFLPLTATGVIVTLNGITNHDFVLSYKLDPPERLAAEVQNNVDVHLTWRAPGSTLPDQWIKWDNGTSSHSIGSAAASTWDAVIRFPVADIAPYAGMRLTKIRFYASSYAANSTELRIWTGPNPATLIYQQPLASVTLSSWNEITLTTPLLITGTEELWFGYNIDYNAGMYPAGTDAGPAATEKNWIHDADGWWEMAASGLPYNWNIQGWVANAKGAEMMIAPLVEKTNPALTPATALNPAPVTPYRGSISAVSEIAAYLGTTRQAFKPENNQAAQPEFVYPDAPLSTWTVLGYNVYRDGTKLNASLVSNLYYDNTSVAPGTYAYTVKAVYDQGLSPAAGPVSVTINACLAPSLLVASAITSTDATFTWTPAPTAPTDWIVEYGPTGFAHGAGTSVPVNGTPSLTVNTLSPGVTYDVYVRTNCGGNSLSNWVGPKTFITKIACPGGAVAETEACGANTNGGCNLVPPAWEPLACGETVCGTSWCNGTSRDTDWFTFTLTQPTNVTFGGQAEFPFLLGLIDGRNGCPVGGFMVSTTGTANQTKSISKALGAGTYYAFVAPSAFTTIITCGGYDAYHVTLSCNTDCVQPVDLGVQNITANSSDLFWTSTASLKNIEWGPGTFVQGAGPNHITGWAANTYTIPTAPSLTYTFYVQSDCSGTLSAWSGPFTFSVPCDAVTLPFAENFDTKVVGVAPSCWTVSGLGLTQWTTVASNNAGGSAPNELRLYWSPSFTGVSRIASPVINTTGNTELNLSFKHYIDWYSNSADFSVVTTSDGGLTWNTAWTINVADYVGPETVAVTINNADVGSANFQLAFEFNGYSFDLNDWYIDDVSLVVAPCSIPVVLPHAENFDAVAIPALPPCWTKYSSASGKPWVSADYTSSAGVAAKSDPNMMFVDFSATDPKNEWLVTPACQLTPGTAYRVKFWVKAPGYAPDPEKLSLVVTTDPSLSGVLAGTVLWDRNDLMLPDYTEFVVSFTPPASGKYYFAWHAYSDANVNFIALDDVTIEVAPPPCLTPTALTAINITATAADLGWTETGTATTWDLEYGAPGFTPGTGTRVTGITVKPYHLAGLTPSTNYEFVVRADCGGANYSSWSAAFPFVTPSAVPFNNTVQDVDVTGIDCFDATNFIVVAGAGPPSHFFTVQTGGEATFIAGVKINFLPGTKVFNGGKLVGRISTGTYCGGKSPAMPAVVTGQETVFSFEQANFTLYPNPTTGNFTLVQKGDKSFGTVKLEIYSMSGERVLTDKMIGEKKHEFRFSDVPAGLYFVKVVADDYVETIKLIKTR